MPDISNPTDPIIDNVNKSTESYILKNDKMLALFYLVIVVGSIIGIMYAQLDIRLLYIPAIIGIIGYGHVKAKIKREFTQQFGASIGFAYSSSADMSSVAGKLFKIGHSQRIYDVLSGTMNGRNSRLFSYQFTVGSGKNSHTYYCTVFETAFSNNMPDIVLTTKASVFFGSLPSIRSF